MIDQSRPRALFGLTVAAASWIALIVAGLLTALLLGWVVLGIVFVGSGPAANGQPVLAILLALFALTGGLASIAARYIASWRSIGLAIALIFASVALSAVTWVLSAPDEALYLARGMAWDGPDSREYMRYSERVISNAPGVFRFQQNLTPTFGWQLRVHGARKSAATMDLCFASGTYSDCPLRTGRQRSRLLA
jgi:hypothetical protein